MNNLNSDGQAAITDRAALERTQFAQGDGWHQLVTSRCPHLFADASVFISNAEMQQMRLLIQAINQVVALPAWHEAVLPEGEKNYIPKALGVFFGYDFHINADGAHLIEINTNAGGGFFVWLLLQSQQRVGALGEVVDKENLEKIFIEMFRCEWRLQRGDAPLKTIAIVDEQPQQQYFYPEFLLAQKMLERAGWLVLIADPSELDMRSDGVYCNEQKIDLIYNRLTDFSLQQHAALRAAYLANQVVLTPHPHAYALVADKRNLARLTDRDSLQAMDVPEPTIAILQAGIPQTKLVLAQDAEDWWPQRKHWFFKPATGYGGKGSYRGANITRKVFGEIIKGGYVAQHIAMPGVRSVRVAGAQPVEFKFDIRCYVYVGEVQLVAARLYQGQTTNFRTAGGGFAVVQVVDELRDF